MTILASIHAANTVDIPFKVFFNDNRDLLGIRIHIAKIGVLTDGTLTFKFEANGQTIQTISKTYTQLNTLGTYWHGMLSVEFPSPIPIRVLPSTRSLEVTITATMTGHTNSSSIYVSLVKEPHLTVPLVHQIAEPYYATYGADAAMDVWHNPFGLEIHTLK